jgi:hypothetical protein
LVLYRRQRLIEYGVILTLVLVLVIEKSKLVIMADGGSRVQVSAPPLA